MRGLMHLHHCSSNCLRLRWHLRGPLLIIPPDMWGDPEGIAEKVAKVLNDNASLFFDSAKIDKTETSRDRT